MLGDWAGGNGVRELGVGCTRFGVGVTIGLGVRVVRAKKGHLWVVTLWCVGEMCLPFSGVEIQGPSPPCSKFASRFVVFMFCQIVGFL